MFEQVSSHDRGEETTTQWRSCQIPTASVCVRARASDKNVSRVHDVTAD